MSRLSRRHFLAGSAVLLGAPALRTAAAAERIEVAIVGAGAAGIAAGRKLAAAGRNVVIFEAGDRIGGRCITDTSIFGMPFDLGAHWIHNEESNPLARLAPATGLDVYAAPRGLNVRVGPREARAGELEALLVGLVRSHRALEEAATAKSDMPASRALPSDLGRWRKTIEFMSGPLVAGKDFSELSAIDLGRAARRDSAAICREGFGTLLTKLAAGLPIRLSSPVTMISWRDGPLIEVGGDILRPRAVILTVSPGVLTDEIIEFIPPLPKRPWDAASALTMGSYDHVALDLPGNPLGLLRDDLVFEQAQGDSSAALLANVSGTSLHLVELAGSIGRQLAAQGEKAMIEYATAWVSDLFGTNINRRVTRSHATRWSRNKWVQGAVAAAAPGKADARKALMEPLANNVWLAGEAVHETKWGTVAGAWESGERAATAILQRLGGAKADDVEKPVRRRRR